MRAPWDREAGRLIAFEGCDGSGKSTQARLLCRWLHARGIVAALTTWNSSPAVAPATKRGKSARALVPVTYSLIHACDFADRYERFIVPHLEAGHVVVADRYGFTGLARDSARGCDPRWVRELYDFAVRPNLTFYCAITPEAALQRLLSGRSRIKYFEAGLDVQPDAGDRAAAFVRFQGRVAAAYDGMQGEFGFHRLDATRSLAEQQRDIRSATAALLAQRVQAARPAKAGRGVQPS